jgi:hypothetical protein
MSLTRLASLLSLLAASLLSGPLVACSGASPEAAKVDAGPDDDGYGGPMVDAGADTGTHAVQLFEAGTADQEAGPSCVAPPPIDPANPMGQACLADMQATCKSALSACAADCACASLAGGCLDTGFTLGVVECLSAAQTVPETNLFDCIYFSAPCNATTAEARDAGTSD